MFWCHHSRALVRLVMAASVSVMRPYSRSAEAILLQRKSNIPITPQQPLSTVVAIGLFTFADPSSSHAAQVEWNLGNGVVRLEDPLVLPGMKPLHNPQLLGSGGGGAAFSFDGSNVVVKVSWVASAASVEHECAIMKTLENNGVKGVEQCLSQNQYPADKRRLMIAMEPLMDDAVANLMDIDKELRPHAVQCIVRTMVQMLASNVVTVDIQPLISKQTGDVLFIDFTEAKELKQPLTFLDVTLISSFCTEMSVLIPDYLLPTASKALLDELQALEQQDSSLSIEAYNALCDLSFTSDEVFDFIDKIIKETSAKGASPGLTAECM